MSKNYEEMPFDELVYRVLGLPFELAKAMEEVSQEGQKKETYSHQHSYNEGHSCGCTHDCHSHKHDNHENKRFVKLEKTPMKKVRPETSTKPVVGKNYVSRNARYFVDLADKVYKSEVFEKNSQIYVSQILDKFERNIRSCRCNFVRCIVVPTYKEIDNTYFDVEVSNFCIGKVLKELHSRGFKISFLAGDAKKPKEFIVGCPD